MSEVTVVSKDVGETRVKRGGEYKKTFEDCGEDYIKRELGVDGI